MQRVFCCCKNKCDVEKKEAEENARTNQNNKRPRVKNIFFDTVPKVAFGINNRYQYAATGGLAAATLSCIVNLLFNVETPFYVTLALTYFFGTISMLMKEGESYRAESKNTEPEESQNITVLNAV